MSKIHEPEKDAAQASEPSPPVLSLADAHLRALSTDELIKLLMTPILKQPANASVRQRVIKLLSEREGSDFARRVLGFSPSEKPI
jgi:hypothetical protein